MEVQTYNSCRQNKSENTSSCSSSILLFLISLEKEEKRVYIKVHEVLLVRATKKRENVIIFLTIRPFTWLWWLLKNFFDWRRVSGGGTNLIPHNYGKNLIICTMVDSQHYM